MRTTMFQFPGMCLLCLALRMLSPVYTLATKLNSTRSTLLTELVTIRRIQAVAVFVS